MFLTKYYLRLFMYDVVDFLHKIVKNLTIYLIKKLV